MGKAAAGGAFFIGLSQGTRVVLTILSAIVVARILSPEDYGVAAMAAPVTAFLLLFQNLGLSQAAIQARTLSHAQSNSLFWINMAASLAIMLALLAISPLVAWFYGDTRPAYYTAASSITVLLSGSTIQHMALLNRDLRFATLARIDIATSVTAFLATVAAALILKSYWALWLGTFIGSTLGRSLTWRSSPWRPTFPITFRGAGDMVRFGGSLTGYNLLNFASRNADNILIARFWGAAPLGLYDRAYKLMMFPIQNISIPLSRVVLPILARMKDEPERFRRSYLMIVRALNMIAVPGIAAAGANSERLIPFLLGDRWAGAAPIFFWLSLAALTPPVGSTAGWLFITSGRGKALIHWGLFYGITAIGAFAIGVQWGAVGVAIGYFVSSLLRFPFLVPWAASGTPVRPADLYLVHAPSLIAAGLTWLAISAMPAIPIVPLLLISFASAYALNLLCNALAPGGRETIVTAVTIGRTMIADRRGKRANTAD